MKMIINMQPIYKFFILAFLQIHFFLISVSASLYNSHVEGEEHVFKFGKGYKPNPELKHSFTPAPEDTHYTFSDAKNPTREMCHTKIENLSSNHENYKEEKDEETATLDTSDSEYFKNIALKLISDKRKSLPEKKEYENKVKDLNKHYETDIRVYKKKDTRRISW